MPLLGIYYVLGAYFATLILSYYSVFSFLKLNFIATLTLLMRK
jgi:hypothetical protein